MSNYIVWGLPAGSTDKMDETLLAESCTTLQHVEMVKTAASKDGWHSFRVWEYDGQAPDFAATVNI